jgi:CheY-like chemotaxis protein
MTPELTLPPVGPAGVGRDHAFHRPDVILLDLGLPGLSGLDLARELRRHPEMAPVGLVALTGWGQEEDRRQTLDAGFDGHLTKPTDSETLERLLAEIASAGAWATAS